MLKDVESFDNSPQIVLIHFEDFSTLGKWILAEFSNELQDIWVGMAIYCVNDQLMSLDPFGSICIFHNAFSENMTYLAF